MMFSNRDEAGRRLAEALRESPLRDPVVLAIPRGGVVVGAALAQELGAELDVVLSRKLRDPHQPELAMGAVGEDGVVHRVRDEWADETTVERERVRQLEEIGRRKEVFRAVRPPAKLEGRSVIVVDDGIATGSTMIAALATARARGPHELIAATPVGSPDRLEEVSRLCDRVVCLHVSRRFFAVGLFYEDFREVSEERAAELLREAWRGRTAEGPA